MGVASPKFLCLLSHWNQTNSVVGLVLKRRNKQVLHAIPFFLWNTGTACHICNAKFPLAVLDTKSYLDGAIK